MTKLLEKAIEAVLQLPPESQDQIALAMLSLSGHEGEPEEVEAAHRPAVLEGLAQAKRRHLATEVETAFHSSDEAPLRSAVGTPLSDGYRCETGQEFWG